MILKTKKINMKIEEINSQHILLCFSSVDSYFWLFKWFSLLFAIVHDLLLFVRFLIYSNYFEFQMRFF